MTETPSVGPDQHDWRQPPQVRPTPIRPCPASNHGRVGEDESKAGRTRTYHNSGDSCMLPTMGRRDAVSISQGGNSTPRRPCRVLRLKLCQLSRQGQRLDKEKHTTTGGKSRMLLTMGRRDAVSIFPGGKSTPHRPCRITRQDSDEEASGTTPFNLPGRSRFHVVADPLADARHCPRWVGRTSKSSASPAPVGRTLRANPAPPSPLPISGPHGDSAWPFLPLIAARVSCTASHGGGAPHILPTMPLGTDPHPKYAHPQFKTWGVSRSLERHRPGPPASRNENANSTFYVASRAGARAKNPERTYHEA